MKKYQVDILYANKDLGSVEVEAESPSQAVTEAENRTIFSVVTDEEWH